MDVANVHQELPRLSPESSMPPSGVCNIFCFPCTCAARIKDLFQAEMLGDNEGVFENALRILEIPFNLTSSFFNGIDLFFKALLYFGFNQSTPFLKTLSRAIPIVGLIVEGFETFFELRSFKQAWEMLQTLKKPPSESLAQLRAQFCPTDQTHEAITQFVSRVFTESSREEQQRCVDSYTQYVNGARKRRLERRVGFECAVRFDKAMLKPTLNTAETKEFLDDIQTQLQKKLLLHALGLIAALLAIASMIGVLYGSAILIPLILVSISSGLSLTRWILAEGLLPCKGWQFEPSYLIPEYLRCLYRRIFTPSGAASVSLQGRVQSAPSLQSTLG